MTKKNSLTKPVSRRLAVLLLNLNADSAATKVIGGYDGRATPHERVHHNPRRAFTNKRLHEPYWLLAWVRIALGALRVPHDLSGALPGESRADDVDLLGGGSPRELEVAHPGPVSLVPNQERPRTGRSR